MKIEIYQHDTLGLDDSRFAIFCQKVQQSSLVILPEYSLNPFFTKLIELDSSPTTHISAKTPTQENTLKPTSAKNPNHTQAQSAHTLAFASPALIAEHSRAQLSFLQSLAHKHHLRFVAPIIRAKSRAKDALYKQIAYISPQKEENFFYTQQRLIAYEHWNEAALFANPQKKTLATPAIFTLQGCKIALLFGFEIHFDELWLKLKSQGVDIVILPCANTFDSAARWRELCKMRAFLNGCAVVRVNRVGEVERDGYIWEFYGDSLLAMPNGEIFDHLGYGKERLSISLEKEQIAQMAREWGFRQL